MHNFPFRSAVLAAGLACAPLAFAAAPPPRACHSPPNIVADTT